MRQHVINRINISTWQADSDAVLPAAMDWLARVVVLHGLVVMLARGTWASGGSTRPSSNAATCQKDMR